MDWNVFKSAPYTENDEIGLLRRTRRPVEETTMHCIAHARK